MLKLTTVFILALLFALPAQAQEYAKADWPSLVRTLIRFNALNSGDDKILDQYAAITECDLYKQFYKDDFKWNQVRAAIRESIRLNIATFPTAYKYETELQLGRYDFQQKLFMFTDKSTIRNINTFVIYSVQGHPCDGVATPDIPASYRAVLDVPVYFLGIPLAQKDAETLLQQMKDDKNDDRIVYARFNLRIIYIDPLRKDIQTGTSSAAAHYTQSNAPDAQSIRIDVHLDSIDFFEDAARTKLIYSSGQN
jgi:hypothetical protein